MMERVYQTVVDDLSMDVHRRLRTRPRMGWDARRFPSAGNRRAVPDRMGIDPPNRSRLSGSTVRNELGLEHAEKGPGRPDATVGFGMSESLPASDFRVPSSRCRGPSGPKRNRLTDTDCR